jgi:hypothetical protein
MTGIGWFVYGLYGGLLFICGGFEVYDWWRSRKHPPPKVPGPDDKFQKLDLP